MRKPRIRKKMYKKVPLNLEIATTSEMLKIAIKNKPKQWSPLDWPNLRTLEIFKNA